MLHSTEKLTESSCRLTDVLITAEISTRLPRTPDLSAEHAALQQLAGGLKGEPEALLQRLTELACVLCGADTAGISRAHGDEFRWQSVAGTYSCYAGLAIPCDQSPCSICLEHAEAQLFAAPGRYFAAFAAVSPPIAELLILPLCTGDKTLSATLWIASHNVQRRFDAEDLRILTALAGFAAAALRIHQAEAENLRFSCTEPLISESTSQEALARLEAILNTVADGIITTDEHGRIESVNRAAERIFGYPTDALLGNNISMLMPKSESNVHDNYLQRYLKSGKRIDNNGIRREVMGRRSDGSLFPLELALSEPRLAGRRLFTGILRDITERKRAEDEVTRHLQELRSANEELARFNCAAVDRELRMVELKKQVNELCVRDGLPQRYRVDFDNHSPQGES